MKPDTQLAFTCFLYDDLAEEKIAEGVAHRTFSHEVMPGVRVDRPKNPLAAVAFTEERMSDMLGQAGMTADIKRGHWREKKGTDTDAVQNVPHRQDLVLVRLA